MGLGRKLVSMTERYAAETLQCQQVFLHCDPSLREYYTKLSYEELPLSSVETVGGNLLLQVPLVGSWEGNEAPPGWETAYDGLPYASLEELITERHQWYLMAKVLKEK